MSDTKKEIAKIHNSVTMILAHAREACERLNAIEFPVESPADPPSPVTGELLQLREQVARLTDENTKAHARFAELRDRVGQAIGSTGLTKWTVDDKRERQRREIQGLTAKLQEARQATGELLQALKDVLASAKPHPTEHPAMYRAWQQGHKAVAHAEQASSRQQKEPK